jgi:hypothetical protein
VLRGQWNSLGPTLDDLRYYSGHFAARHEHWTNLLCTPHFPRFRQRGGRQFGDASILHLSGWQHSVHDHQCHAIGVSAVAVQLYDWHLCVGDGRVCAANNGQRQFEHYSTRRLSN